MPEAVPIRDAATVILVRDAGTDPRVLVGQRGQSAVFMPDTYVFPGGAVDAADADVALEGALSETCRGRLLKRSGHATPEALAAAAIRELWEETGLILGRAGLWEDAPRDWVDFAAAGFRPDASGLSFFFRAVTPPGRPRRFDARFFLASADALGNDPDALPEGAGELSRLRWVPLAEVRRLKLAFITQLVLAELDRHLPDTGPPERVPLVTNDDMESQVIWL